MDCKTSDVARYFTLLEHTAQTIFQLFLLGGIEAQLHLQSDMFSQNKAPVLQE